MRIILLLCLAISLTGAAPQDDKDDVAAAAKRAVEAKNYSFKGETKTDMPSFGGGGEQERPPSKFKGKHDSEAGSHILTENQEIVKFKGKTAVRPRADWRVIDESEEGGQRRRRRGFGRGMGRMLGGGRGFVAPHEELKDFDAKISKAEKTDATETVGEIDCSVYNVTFTEEAALAMFPVGRMMERMEDAELTATGKLWIDGEGNILKYQTDVSFSGAFRDNDFEMSRTRTVMLYDIGRTEVKIPESAKKAIEGQEEDY